MGALRHNCVHILLYVLNTRVSLEKKSLNSCFLGHILEYNIIRLKKKIKHFYEKKHLIFFFRWTFKLCKCITFKLLDKVLPQTRSFSTWMTSREVANKSETKKDKLFIYTQSSLFYFNNRVYLCPRPKLLWNKHVCNHFVFAHSTFCVDVGIWVFE